MTKDRCTICVIGAGLVGTLTALRAARANPTHSVVLLDSQTAGRGAIHVSSALLLNFAFDREVKYMAQSSGCFYRDNIANFADITEEFPFVWVVRPEYADHLREACNEELQLVAGEQVETLQVPAWASPRAAGKRYFQQTGLRAKSIKLHARLLELFLSLPNAKLMEGFRVTAVMPSGEGLAIMSEMATLSACKAVVAVGPWISRSPFAEDLRDQNIRVKKVVSFHVAFDDTITKPVGFGFLEEEVYIVPEFEKKRYVISITSQDWDVTPEDGTLTYSRQDLDVYDATLRRVRLEPLSPLSASVFADAYSADCLPRIVCPPKFGGNLAICTATSGYGVKVGPALAAKSLKTIGITV